jgi:predicted enzyme related to lactoylglutathione lyase
VAQAKAVSVMYFVDDPKAAAAWYAAHLFRDVLIQEEAGFVWFDTGAIEVGFHPSHDEKNLPGGGSVVYWQVENFGPTLKAMLQDGCKSWRGPLQISPSRTICQVRDPFGNIIGLEGTPD